MFKKLVSHLPFNPGLIQQISFYGKRLHQEESIRRLSFFFIAATMIVNVVAFASPAQNTLAGTDGHIMVGGGSSTKEGVLAKYDQDPWVRAVYATFDIYRTDIEKMTLTSINTKAGWAQPLVTAGRRPNGSAGEWSRDVSGTSIFVHSLDAAFRSDTIQALVCEASTCGRYKGIAMDCGNPIKSSLESTPVEAPKVPIGYVDGSNCTGIFGWAYNNEHARYVHIYVDKPAFGGAIAGQDYYEVNAIQDTRPDVGAVYPGTPSSVGWSWDGGPLRDDNANHTLWVYVSDRVENYAMLTNGDGVAVNFTCPKTVVSICPSGPLAGRTPPDNDLRNCPASPIASCAKLSVLSNKVQKGTEARFTASATIANGATVSSYIFDFGNGTKTINSNATSVDVTQKYNDVGTYTATVHVTTSEGVKTSNDCTVTLEVIPQPVPCSYDPSLLASDDECQPCPENPLLPASNKELCVPIITLQKKVSNVTAGLLDANGTQAKGGDVLEYTLITTNGAKKMSAKHTTKENIADILDYADLLPDSSATLDKDKNLVWPEQTILASSQLKQVFRVKIKDVIPATPAATANAGTYDLKLTNVYGNTTTVTLPCPPALCVQTRVEKLPNTGPGMSLALTFISLVVISYFYARSRLLGKEITIIKHDFARGI